MIWRFSERIEVLDGQTEDFLMTLACLGGYCTVSQARKMGMAQSNTRAFHHLSRLQHRGLLRRVADYPVVYQVTKSVTRLLGRDLRARRPHTIETVRTRLLGVSFYLDALRWPAEFILNPERKVAVFGEFGYPATVVPQLWGKPFLSRAFVLKGPGPRLCVALVDKYHGSPFMQVWRFLKKFLTCLEHNPTGLQLLIAVGTRQRFRLYQQMLRKYRIQKLAKGRFQIPLKPYKVRVPVPQVPKLRQPASPLPFEPEAWEESDASEPDWPHEVVESEW